jgi:hypothetical protein
MPTLSPIPYRVPIVDKRTGTIDRNWQQWLEALLTRIGGTGDLDRIGDLEALLTADAAAVRAQLHGMAADIADLTAFAVFGSVPGREEESTDIFAGLSVAEGQRLSEAIQDAETLNIFSW